MVGAAKRSFPTPPPASDRMVLVHALGSATEPRPVAALWAVAALAAPTVPCYLLMADRFEKSPSLHTDFQSKVEKPVETFFVMLAPALEFRQDREPGDGIARLPRWRMDLSSFLGSVKSLVRKAGAVEDEGQLSEAVLDLCRQATESLESDVQQHQGGSTRPADAQCSCA